jgi:hypothetical protein
VALRKIALQGWGTDHVRLALAAVMQQGQISRLGFSIEYEADLGALPKRDAALVLDVLGPAVAELDTMRRTKGFQALRTQEQMQLFYLLGGSTYLSERAPAVLRRMLADRRLNLDDPATFRTMISEGKYLGFNVKMPRGKAEPPASYTIGSAARHPNYVFGGQIGEIAHALIYNVTISVKRPNGKTVEHRIPVFIPESGVGIKQGRANFIIPTVAEVARVLASLPDAARIKVARVEVRRFPKPTESSVGRAGEKFEIAAEAGAEGILYIYPQTGRKVEPAELTADVLHETGHTASQAAWGNDDDTRWDPWRRAMKSDGLVPSRYSMESTADDFAESWALYIPAVDKAREAEVRALIPERCKLMDTLLAQLPTSSPVRGRPR